MKHLHPSVIEVAGFAKSYSGFAAVRDLSFLVRPGEWEGRSAAFTVAGCCGYRLDRRAARRAA